MNPEPTPTGLNLLPGLQGLPGLPMSAEGESVFAEPWQAQAFALALQLHAQGLFTWTEWATRLSARIQAAQRAGDADLGDTYYRHWLAALEDLVAAKGASSRAELLRYAAAWDAAADRTPHGQPISLLPRDFSTV